MLIAVDKEEHFMKSIVAKVKVQFVCNKTF